MKKLMAMTAAGLLFGLFGCTGGGGSGDSSSTSKGFKGLGSIWSLDITGSSFTLTRDADSDGDVDTTSGTDISVSGSSQYFSDTLFTKFTVNSASGSGAPTAGTNAYGLEIPNFAYFLQPTDANAEPIVLLKSGSCPSGGAVLNWIIAKWETGSFPTNDPADESDAMGTATFNSSADELTLTRYVFHDASALAAYPAFSIGNCSNGVYSFADPGNPSMTTTMFATGLGGMLVNPGSGVIFAAPQLSADPSLSDLAGTYSGAIFTTAAGTQAAKVVLNSTGDGTGQSIDPEDDSSLGGSVTIDLTTVKAGLKGLVHGTIDVGTGARPLNCLFSNVDGKKVLACNGADGNATGSPARYPVFFFLGVMR